MMEFIVLPGIGGSGDAHWQTLWEKAEPEFRRFRPANWDIPDLEDWIGALERAVRGANRPPILVAHSLACLLVAHWAARPHIPVAGAFLVAVPDPAGPEFPTCAKAFGAFPTSPLPFPTLVIASSNDPYATVAHVERCAQAWGATLIVAGALGHINATSGLDAWPEGRAHLQAFRAGMGRT